MRFDAAAKFDRKEKCGAEANMAKLLASEAAWEAANVCLNTYGGYGFARDYDVERKFRETRLLTVAPVSNNLILAFLGQNVLGMPKVGTECRCHEITKARNQATQEFVFCVFVAEDKKRGSPKWTRKRRCCVRGCSCPEIASG